ncbi:MAG: hypothetical protein IRZ08_05700 [Frankia sp.]|nr:hypothetical protein [Frankia sp.]
MVTAIVLIGILVLLTIVALRWGADSRDGRDWRPPRSRQPDQPPVWLGGFRPGAERATVASARPGDPHRC